MNKNNKNNTRNLSLNIIPREEHNISRKDIDDNALKVLNRLNKAGYEAYLVGGGVRDLLLGKKPKDFDIATNATPEQIQALFRNCRLIGRRFRLAHILFGREIIEVATFRGHHLEQNNKIASQSDDGMLLRDNVYGNIDQDAERRDFTVNALYYNIHDFSLRDYANGLNDLDRGLLRLIGDPHTRYREDPVRMLRAIRFAAKLDMQIEEQTAAPIYELAPLLRDIPSARLFEESLKLLQSGYGYETYHLLREYQLFAPLFPLISEHFSESGNTKCERMIEHALDSTDERIADEKRVNPAFLFAAMLWYPLETRAEEISFESGLGYYDAIMIAANDILDEQVKSIAIPRRFTGVIRDIWQLQLRLPRRYGNRAFKMLELTKFRAGFDLLKMRASVEGGKLIELADWWDDFQFCSQEDKIQMIKALGQESPARKSRRHKKNHNHNKSFKR